MSWFRKTGNIACAVMAGVLATLAVSFYAGRSRHVRRPAPAGDAKEFFAQTQPGVVEGSSLALVVRNANSSCLAPAGEAFLEALGVDSQSPTNSIVRFLSASGLADSKFRWAVFSMGTVPGGAADNLEAMPDICLAVSFTHDLEKIMDAYDRYKRPDSPLAFVRDSASGMPVWRARTVDSSGLFGDESLAALASLSGELLLVGSTEKALSRQIELYRDGFGEDPFFGRLSESEDAFRLFIPDFGEIATRFAPGGAGAFAPLDVYMPDGAAKFRALKEFDFIMAPSKKGGLKLKFAFRAATADDASAMSTLVKAFILKTKASIGTAKDGNGDELSGILRESLSGAEVSAKDEYVKISVPLSDEGVKKAILFLKEGVIP